MPLEDSIAALPRTTEKWARFLLDLDIVPMWTPGCVFPCEMAFLMGYCEALGLKEFIESGRQEGLSTYALGHFARKSDVVIHSIDFEDNKQIALTCRERVAGLPINLLVGDSWNELGQLMSQINEPTGVFIDGPKNWSAISLLCASAAYPAVRMIAAHNLRPGGSIRTFIEKFSPVAVGYTDLLPPGLPVFEELRRLELKRVADLGVKGDTRSTLAVVPVTEENRAKLASAFSAHFRLYPPPVVRLAWRSRNLSALPRLSWLSYKLFGPEDKGEPDSLSV